MYAIRALAREQFTRTVLPHVEPLAFALRPGQSVGFKELRWIWEHDRDVQALLGEHGKAGDRDRTPVEYL